MGRSAEQLRGDKTREKEAKAGWVARTRRLAEPLSPRGPQPVFLRVRACFVGLNGPPEPHSEVPAK